MRRRNHGRRPPHVPPSFCRARCLHSHRLRLGLAQPGILVAIDAGRSTQGLGWMIFGAREFLNTDVMMAGIAVIAIIELSLEKFVFQKIENYTGGALGHDHRMTKTE